MMKVHRVAGSKFAGPLLECRGTRTMAHAHAPPLAAAAAAAEGLPACLVHKLCSCQLLTLFVQASWHMQCAIMCRLPVPMPGATLRLPALHQALRGGGSSGMPGRAAPSAPACALYVKLRAVQSGTRWCSPS